MIGSRLHRSYCHGHIAMASDDDNRRLAPLLGEAIEQIKPTQARKPDIEQYAGWLFQIDGCQKLFCRWESLRIEISRRHQQRYGVPDVGVVVDNMDSFIT